jgi:transcription initiation factor TFIIIB Brf1 subunit/transcription initiation factor TFIIB
MARHGSYNCPNCDSTEVFVTFEGKLVCNDCMWISPEPVVEEKK